MFGVVTQNTLCVHFMDTEISNLYASSFCATFGEFACGHLEPRCPCLRPLELTALLLKLMALTVGLNAPRLELTVLLVLVH